MIVVTYADMIAELDRELRLRRHLYPGWVRLARLTQYQAHRQIEIMEAVRDNIERQRQGAPEAAGP